MPDETRDPVDTVGEKVLAIFGELAGDRVRRLDGGTYAGDAIRAFAGALEGAYGTKLAGELGFHLADWNSDAAFLVAVHLYPERFTPEEIEAGVGLFLVHAPNHIREACRLSGTPGWDDFPGPLPGPGDGERT